MKSISLFVFILLGIVFTKTNAQNLPAYLPANGLVAWYPFNGNANDESGNGNDGVVNGATLTSDRIGNQSNAYDFNALNWSNGAGGDYIYIPYNSSFNSPNISISVWFWIATSSITNQNHLSIIKRFEQGYTNPNGQTWGLAKKIIGGNLETFILPPNTTNNYTSFLSFSGPTLNSGQWTNGILTFDGIKMRTYVNGVLVGEMNANGMSMNIDGSSGISIGTSIQANGIWDPFNGKIDDIAIYNRALTQEEITALYTGTPVNNNGGNTTASVPPGIPYQAVVRNSNGQVAANTAATTKFTLHQNTTDGAVEYQETHALTTNAQGLVSAVIGQGTAVQGTFAGINWSNTTKFLQVEVDLGNGYVDLGTQQLMSVPFALYAANGPVGPQGPQGPAGADGAAGATGPQGPVGAGVTSVVTSNNQWVITFSDGTTTTFPIGNGNSATNSQTFHYLSDGF